MPFTLAEEKLSAYLMQVVTSWLTHGQLSSHPRSSTAVYLQRNPERLFKPDTHHPLRLHYLNMLQEKNSLSDSGTRGFHRIRDAAHDFKSKQFQRHCAYAPNDTYGNVNAETAVAAGLSVRV